MYDETYGINDFWEVIENELEYDPNFKEVTD